METKREPNYDLLRILSTIAVIVIHVSGRYASAIYDPTFFGKIYRDHALFSVLANVLSRFSVPCFFMCSGAFLLGNRKNADFNTFYSKSIKKIGVHTLVFSCLYIVYSLTKAAVSSVILHERSMTVSLSAIIKDIVTGVPFFHMWYMTVLVGIYLIVPVVIRIDESLLESGIDIYRYFSYLMLCLSSLGYITSKHDLEWDIGKQIYFLSYLLVGYSIRKESRQKNNLKGLLFIWGGVVLSIFLAYANTIRALNGVDITTVYMNFLGYSPLSPIEVLVSVLIFKGFTLLSVKGNYSYLSSYSFFIYLIHGGFFDLFSLIIKRYGFIYDCRIVITCGCLVIFFLSLGLAVFYGHFWQFVDRRLSLTAKVCGFLRLNN